MVKYWNALKEHKQLLCVFCFVSFYTIWGLIDSMYYYAYENLWHCLPGVLLMLYCFFGFPGKRLKNGFFFSVFIHCLVWLYFLFESATFRYYRYEPLDLSSVPDFVVKELLILFPHIIFFAFLSFVALRNNVQSLRMKKRNIIVAFILFLVVLIPEIVSATNVIANNFDLYYLFFDWLVPWFAEGGYWYALCLLLPISIKRRMMLHQSVETDDTCEGEQES